MAYENADYTQETAYSPKHLVVGGNVQTRKITLLSGQNLLAGAVLGLISLGAATVTPGAAVSGSGGTPGNGSIGTVTADAGAPAGVYQVRILNPATDAGAFEVIKPDGSIDGNGTVGVAYNGTINFTLADGSTDFVEDDRIPVTVSYAAGSEKAKLSLAAATDGSQTPNLILAYDTDASGGDVETIAYETGTFAEDALVLGSGHTVASIREGLRGRGILIDA